jgi:hypothetical protein
VSPLRRRRARGIEAQASEERRAAQAGVPPEITGLSYTLDELDHGPVTRDEARSLPAITGALGIIAGRGSTLPLRRFTAAGEPSDPGSFLVHPEPDVNRPLQFTLFSTLADMALAGVAYWRIVVRDFRGFPLAAVKLDVASVGVNSHRVPGIGMVIDSWTVDGEPLDLGELIRFAGPVPGGWCRAGARSIRIGLALERAAKRYADEPVPSIILRNESGVDLPEAKVDSILARWKKARNDHATAYLNTALSATPVGFNARDLQLVEGRQQNVLEVSRLTGVPYGLLGAAPTGSSVTYRNLEGEAHQAFDAMHPYLASIEQRLSQEDVTPRGQSVRFDLTAMLRPDTSTLVDMIARLEPLGVLSVPESRAMLGLPAESPAPAPSSPALAPPPPAALPTPGSGATS